MRITSLIAAALLLAIALPAFAMDKPRDWKPPALDRIPNLREEWRNVVIELASYAKGRNRDFTVLVRGGVELMVKGDYEVVWDELHDPNGKNFEKRLPVRAAFRPYLKVLDGMVLDGLYCGPEALGMPLNKAIRDRVDLDNILAEERARGVHRPPIPVHYGPFSLDPREELRKAAETRRMAEHDERQRRNIYALDAMRQFGRRILSIESCKTQKDVDSAYQGAERDRVLTYAGIDNEDLSLLPKGHPRHENAAPVASIAATRNWLPLLRTDRFGSKAEWVMGLEKTNQDVLLIDVAHRGIDPLTKDEIKRLRYKELGSSRLVFAVLPVGKAFDWRWYWQKGWEVGNPSFLFAPIPEDPGSFMTNMSDAKWRELLGKYLAGIMDLGFDGVVLDNLDTYLWFEELMPLEG